MPYNNKIAEKNCFDFFFKNALLSSLPYLVLWVLTIVFSPISDYLINSGRISVSVARKLFNSIGHWIPMVTLIALSYTTDTTLAVFLLAIAVGMSAGTNVGFLINHIDLSPNFAGSKANLKYKLRRFLINFFLHFHSFNGHYK